jgi:hypothetical protein
MLDVDGALYRLPNAAFDRMLHDPLRHRLPRFAGQRVRTAEIAVELVNGQPTRVVRSSFNIVTFRNSSALVPPLSDRHLRARVELALAPGTPRRYAAVADASTRFVARGGQWTPSAADRRRIEQTALARLRIKVPSGVDISVRDAVFLGVRIRPKSVVARAKWPST